MKNKNYISEKNLFGKEWNDIEANTEKPSTYRKLLLIDHKEFVSKIKEQNKKFVREVVESIYNGDLYLLKNAIDKKKVKNIIDKATDFFKSNPSVFHKMVEGTPNFHRWIDQNIADKFYSIKHVKRSLFLFPWNKDISDIKKVVMDACAPLKFLSGLSEYEFTNNTPKDKIIERVQIVRYPPTGYIEPHQDNSNIIRLIISGYLSKRGKDYKKGGFYLIDKKNGKLDMESQIDEGDVGFFYATLRHGMEAIDPTKKPEINKKEGRWWFGLNMHNSDVIQSRHVAKPYDITSKLG